MNPNISFTFLTFLTCTHNSNTIPNQVPPLIRQKKMFQKNTHVSKKLSSIHRRQQRNGAIIHDVPSVKYNKKNEIFSH